MKSFIKDYSKDAALLTEMINQETKTGKTKLEYTPQALQAVENLKRHLLSPLMLHSVDLTIANSELHIFSDASDRSYGAVLFQRIVKQDGTFEYRLCDYATKTI